MKLCKYRLHVRDVLEWSEAKLWSLQRPGLVELTFDDGSVIENTDTVDLIISWYYWQIAYAYTELEITQDIYLNGEVLTDGKHRELMDNAIAPTIDNANIDKEEVWLIAYRDVYNKLYNAIVTHLLKYVTSTDVPHILEILFDPEVHDANQRVTNSLHTIDRVYGVLRKVFESKYPHNPICRARNNRTVKEEQLYQSFGPLGLRTDIDSIMYKRPVPRGFAMGFRTIADLCKESRSCAKALLFNKDPVASAEYFNRKLQLVCAVIRRIVAGDCGTKSAHVIYIPSGGKGKEIVDDLAGLYEILEDDSLREIRRGDYHLCGTEIRFRTTMTCLHLPKQCVCETCYGKTSYSIPWDSNPGHVSCTAINKRITQLIISTKHLDFIVHKFKVSLDGPEAYYLATNDKYLENLYLAPERKGEHLKMRIVKEDAERLVDINYWANLINIVPGNISSLFTLEFMTVAENGTYTKIEDFDVVKHSIRPSLSLDMLSYMKEQRWETLDRHYVVDLSDWCWDKPLLTYPLKHDSMTEYADRVERFIRSSNAIGEDDDNKSRKRTPTTKQAMLTRYNDPTSAMMDCYYLITEKLKGVHIGHVATVLAATRANNPAENDYYMPAGLEQGSFAPHDNLMMFRSGAVYVLYEKQYEFFDELRSYVIKDRCTSVMDDVIHIDPDKYPSRERARLLGSN